MRTNRGFSLIEQMITLVIVSTSILGVVKMQAALSGTELVSKQRAEAIGFTQQVIENYRQSPSYPPTYTSTAVGADSLCTGSFLEVCKTTTSAVYKAVSTITTDSTLQVTTVTVTTTWSTKNEINTVTLTTKIPNSSMYDTGRLMLAYNTANEGSLTSETPSTTTPPEIIVLGASIAGGEITSTGNGNGNGSSGGTSGETSGGTSDGNGNNSTPPSTATPNSVTYACSMTAKDTVTSVSGNGSNRTAVWSAISYTMNSNQPAACSSVNPAMVSTKCTPANTVTNQTVVGNTSSCSYSSSVQVTQ